MPVRLFGCTGAGRAGPPVPIRYPKLYGHGSSSIAVGGSRLRDVVKAATALHRRRVAVAFRSRHSPIALGFGMPSFGIRAHIANLRGTIMARCEAAIVGL